MAKYRVNSALYLLLILGLIFPSTSFAQSSFFWMRCSVWSDPTFLDSVDKQIYISGLNDGLIFSQMIIQGIELPDMSIDVTIRVVDDLCDDLGNLNIPIPFILKIAALRINGEDQEDSIEMELLRLRREWSNEN